jgi:putative transposase
LILFGEDSLRRAIREFVMHYPCERNHQGLDNRLINSKLEPPATGGVCRRERLGGMLNYYYCPAA